MDTVVLGWSACVLNKQHIMATSPGTPTPFDAFNATARQRQRLRAEDVQISDTQLSLVLEGLGSCR